MPILITESTSKAAVLLDYLKKQFPNIDSVPKQIISMTDDEETNKIPLIIQKIKEEDATLISEAGTPLMSDPGYKLVCEAIRQGIKTIPIPGPTSIIAALSVSGLPPNKFTFIGFLPRSKGKRRKELENFRKSNSTLILFESPHRLIQTLQGIYQILGNINVVIARELTKIHEEIRREKIKDALRHFEKMKPKGEFVILLSPS